MSGENGASSGAAAAQERRHDTPTAVLLERDNRRWMGSPARWIRMAGGEFDDGLYLEFAKRFTAEPGETGTGGIVLEISAVSRYEVAVNGQVIGSGPAAGSAALRFYHRYVVPQDLLRSGPDANLITVLFFHDGPNVTTVQGFTYGEPGLLARLWAGNTCLAVTDETWRVRRSPVYSRAARMVSAWGGFKEFYHGEARDHWHLPEYDHSGWSCAVAVAEPLSPRFAKNLCLCDVPELEKTQAAPARLVEATPALGRIALPEEYRAFPAPWSGAPVGFAPGEPGAMPSLTLDFGTMMVGYPEIIVTGPPCVFEVWYGETLEMARLDVVHTGATDGEAVWRAFHRRGFRFLKIVFIALSGQTTLTGVTQCNAWYAFDRRGGLTLPADPLLQKTLEVTRHTMRANSSYHYEDCPVREQALWVLDMRVMSLVNHYLFGNPELTAKCLRQCFALQDETGAIPATGPWPNTSYSADFPMHLAATVREYFEHTGDRALPEEALPFLRRMGDWINGWRDDSGDGLLDTDRGGAPPPFLDWSERIEKLGKTTVLNALYKVFLEDMAFFERHFGVPDRSPELNAQAQRVAAAANRLLFHREEGVYRDAWRRGSLLPTVSRQANMAALYAGFITDEAQAAALLSRLLGEEERFPPPFGPSYYLIIFDAMARRGHPRAIRDTIARYWGAMLARGATTWWEVFDPTTPRWVYPHTFLGNIPTFERDEIPISACHGWSGAPGYAIPRYLLGVDLSQVWRGQIVIGPGLPEVRAGAEYAVPVAGGMLRLVFGGKESIEVREAPPGIEVTALPPSARSEEPKAESRYRPKTFRPAAPTRDA